MWGAGTTQLSLRALVSHQCVPGSIPFQCHMSVCCSSCSEGKRAEWSARRTRSQAVPGTSPALTTTWICFAVALSSNPRPPLLLLFFGLSEIYKFQFDHDKGPASNYPEVMPYWSYSQITLSLSSQLTWDCFKAEKRNRHARVLTVRQPPSLKKTNL